MTPHRGSTTRPDAPIRSVELPEGRYLSCTFQISPDAGGQTRALLLRNRILAIEAGVRPDVLTFTPTPDYYERQRVLLDRGLLIDEVGYLNIYEHYRTHGWGDRPSTGESLADLGTYRMGEESRPDGTPWRIVYRPPGPGPLVFDYLRPDGSPYLRIPQFKVTVRSTWRCRIQQVGENGEVVGEFRAVGQWFRGWIRDLAPRPQRAFVFIDSRYLVPFIVPMKVRRVHLIYTMHNIHVQQPRQWNAGLNRVYRRVLARIDGMDAMVTLTERQRDDIGERRGLTSNMFVVPNPVEVPQRPAEEPARDPRLVTIVARLERQKHLTDAIAAFRMVVDEVSDARLEIYGRGSQRRRLEHELERKGLVGSVALRGYDPRAREVLWTSSAFLMTSSFEGYPLSTLESVSRGCPVVSYDIKYGPREQITHGVDGFLVPAGDRSELARRVIELLRSPELVQRMSTAASRKAAQFGPDAFLANWARVLRSTIEEKPYRTRIDRVDLELDRLRVIRFNRLLRLVDRSRDRGAVDLAGVLTVEGHSRRSGLDSAEIGFAAIDDATGEVTELPIKVRRKENEFAIRAVTKIAGLPGGGTSDAVWLRLRLTWRNSSWEADLGRPHALVRPARATQEAVSPAR
ncbi:MAG: glycosyltransferase [Thermoleophilaceae bacterium]|nr:glycosyltransferase [Thermoleophilaceae bacterium]